MNHAKCYISGYPRPQFVRREWQDLNGQWAFIEAESTEHYGGGIKGGEQITVPFAPECKKSGIGRAVTKPVVWYSRKVKIDKPSRKRVHLVFEGCDYLTKVYINGKYAGEHKGAYTRFSFDITALIKTGENTVAVSCYDDRDCRRARGKQSWKDGVFGCWYAPTTGIYKSVWLDYSGESYIKNIKITPDAFDYSVKFAPEVYGDTAALTLRTVISKNGKEVARSENALSELCEFSMRISRENEHYSAHLWWPSKPVIFDIEFELLKNGKTVDRVGSYTAMRHIKTENGKFFVNHKPQMLRLILDQGYYGDAGLTPPTEAAMVRDIELTKEMGFNGVRKHQKTEDERYLYYADIMGLYVWCEMPSPYAFSDRTVTNVAEEWSGVVQQFYNHPSVIAWVPLNESWGVFNIPGDKAQQNFASAMYYLTKSLDPLRPAVCNDGWQHTKTDILTIHDYTQEPELFENLFADLKTTTEGACTSGVYTPLVSGYPYEGQPIMISEYGGAAIDGIGSGEWGYGRNVKDADGLVERYRALTKAIIDTGFISGYCYTQLTDVSQEVNGFLTESREAKADLGKIAEVNKLR